MTSSGITSRHAPIRSHRRLFVSFLSTYALLLVQASKNVVMVWTKGCMDRFLDVSDTAETDFVRKEYRLAMQLKKNMVAVKHEDFVFPDASRVPDEIQPVCDINARFQ